MGSLGEFETWRPQVYPHSDLQQVTCPCGREKYCSSKCLEKAREEYHGAMCPGKSAENSRGIAYDRLVELSKYVHSFSELRQNSESIFMKICKKILSSCTKLWKMGEISPKMYRKFTEISEIWGVQMSCWSLRCFRLASCTRKSRGKLPEISMKFSRIMSVVKWRASATRWH